MTKNEDHDDKKTNPHLKKIQEKAKESAGKAKVKIEKAYDDFKSNDKVSEFLKFTTEHRRDTIVYIVLLLGLIITLFYPFIGNMIIGIVVGLYFAEEILAKSHKLSAIIEKQGLFRVVIFCFLGVALFLAAPGIFLGAAVALAAKLLMNQNNDS